MKREDRSTKTKPFEIPKRLIWESWKQVAANDGAPGVDKESTQVFQVRVGGNLCVVTNGARGPGWHDVVQPSPACLCIGIICSTKAMDKKSRMSREIHVRFCESPRGQFPRATRP